MIQFIFYDHLSLSLAQSQTISKDSNGLLAAGISSLIIGLISIIFSVSFTVICRKCVHFQVKNLFL